MKVPHPLALLASLSLLAPTPLAQVDVLGQDDLRAPVAPKPAPLPFSVRDGLPLGDEVPALRLAPLDAAAVRAEDDRRAASGDKVLRYGIGRELLLGLEDGTWHGLSDGSLLWTADVVSAGALGVRLEVTELDLPKGGEWMAWSVAQPERVAGPWTERGPLGDGTSWTATLPGERVRVEYRLPPETTDFDARPFTIARLQHVYRDPAATPVLGEAANVFLGAGGCHNDVTCYGAWADVARAVAGIGFISGDSLFCTGQLLNTQSSDQTPYWLTANHCLSTNSTAQSAEIYWLYQSATCNGGPPSLASVPQSAVCSLLSTGASSDYTLLMVEGTLPTGLFWAGWTSSNVSNGTSSTCVHHPSGDYKRISFGSKSSATGCGGSDHVRINWSDGPTEPGSSGSGVFRNDTQQLFGQLHCGGSACGNETNDDYGAFTSTYPNISGLLTAGSDDVLEPNASCAAAANTGPGSWSGLVVKSTDEDWYRISLGAGGSLSVDVDFTHAFGDIDLQLLDACGGTVVATAETGDDDELLNYVNNGAAGDFFLRVFLFSDTRNSYDMTITGGGGPGGPANDACANATPVSNGQFAGTLTGATNDGGASCGTSSSNADVWYVFTAGGAGTLDVSTCGSHDLPGVDLGTDTVLSLHSGCPGSAGNQIDCNDDGPGTCSGIDQGQVRDSALSMSVSAGQTVLIRVSHWSTSAAGDFVLNVSSTSSGPANDSCAQATSVGVGSFAGTLVGATNDGGAGCGTSSSNGDVWYEYTATCPETVTFSTCGSNDIGGVDQGTDTVLSVHSACPGTSGNQLGCNDDSSATCGGIDQGDVRDSAVSVALSAGQTVFVRVSHWNTSTPGAFQLEVTSTEGCAPTDPGTPFCFGIFCPCFNDDPTAGCATSIGSGATLSGAGSTSVSADDLVLTVGNIPSPNANGIVFMGPNILPQFTPTGSDGLACTGGGIRYPGILDDNAPPNELVQSNLVAGAAAAGLTISSGSTWHFQSWFRNTTGSPCGGSSNLSNAYSVSFTP